MASENSSECCDDPSFAVICSFLEQFGEKCGITYPPFSKLQTMFESIQEVDPSLKLLYIRLLRKARRQVKPDLWERALVSFCRTSAGAETDAWELERFGYRHASLAVKLRIMKNLCECQFDRNKKLKEAVNAISARSLRAQPLGRDRRGNSYWWHLDAARQVRVYCEDHDEETWQLVASDRQGVAELIARLKADTGGELASSSSSDRKEDESEKSRVSQLLPDVGGVEKSPPPPPPPPPSAVSGADNDQPATLSTTSQDRGQSDDEAEVKLEAVSAEPTSQQSQELSEAVVGACEPMTAAIDMKMKASGDEKTDSFVGDEVSTCEGKIERQEMCDSSCEKVDSLCEDVMSDSKAPSTSSASDKAPCTGTTTCPPSLDVDMTETNPLGAADQPSLMENSQSASESTTKQTSDSLNDSSLSVDASVNRTATPDPEAKESSVIVDPVSSPHKPTLSEQSSTSLRQTAIAECQRASSTSSHDGGGALSPSTKNQPETESPSDCERHIDATVDGQKVSECSSVFKQAPAAICGSSQDEKSQDAAPDRDQSSEKSSDHDEVEGQPSHSEAETNHTVDNYDALGKKRILNESSTADTLKELTSTSSNASSDHTIHLSGGDGTVASDQCDVSRSVQSPVVLSNADNVETASEARQSETVSETKTPGIASGMVDSQTDCEQTNASSTSEAVESVAAKSDTNESEMRMNEPSNKTAVAQIDHTSDLHTEQHTDIASSRVTADTSAQENNTAISHTDENSTPSEDTAHNTSIDTVQSGRSDNTSNPDSGDVVEEPTMLISGNGSGAECLAAPSPPAADGTAYNECCEACIGRRRRQLTSDIDRLDASGVSPAVESLLLLVSGNGAGAECAGGNAAACGETQAAAAANVAAVGNGAVQCVDAPDCVENSTDAAAADDASCSPKKRRGRRKRTQLESLMEVAAAVSPTAQDLTVTDNGGRRRSSRVAHLRQQEESERLQQQEQLLSSLKHQALLKKIAAAKRKCRLESRAAAVVDEADDDDDEASHIVSSKKDKEKGTNKNKKRRKRKKKKKRRAVGQAAWQTSSDSSSSASNDAAGSVDADDDFDAQLFGDCVDADEAGLAAGSSLLADALLFRSDHEFSPESDLDRDAGDGDGDGGDGGDFTPMRRARTAGSVGRKRKHLSRQRLPTDTTSTTISGEADDDGATSDHSGGSEGPGSVCVRCGNGDHPECILLCDSCDAGWHTSCLRPALLCVPEGDWHCPPCQHHELVACLEQRLADYDVVLRRRDNDQLRRERLEYVSISMANVLASSGADGTAECDAGDERKRAARSQRRPMASGESADDSGDDSSSDDQDDSSRDGDDRNSSASGSFDDRPPDSDEDTGHHRRRARRAAATASSDRVKHFDQLIDAAIRDDLDEMVAVDVSAASPVNHQQNGDDPEHRQSGEGGVDGGRGGRRKKRRINDLDEDYDDDADDASFRASASNDSDAEDLDDDDDEEEQESDLDPHEMRRLRAKARRSRAKIPRRRSARSTRKRRNAYLSDSESDEASQSQSDDDEDDADEDETSGEDVSWRRRTSKRPANRRFVASSDSAASDDSWKKRKKRRKTTAKPAAKSGGKKSDGGGGRKRSRQLGSGSSGDRKGAPAARRRKQSSLGDGREGDSTSQPPTRRTRGKQTNYALILQSESDSDTLRPIEPMSIGGVRRPTSPATSGSGEEFRPSADEDEDTTVTTSVTTSITTTVTTSSSKTEPSELPRTVEAVANDSVVSSLAADSTIEDTTTHASADNQPAEEDSSTASLPDHSARDLVVDEDDKVEDAKNVNEKENDLANASSSSLCVDVKHSKDIPHDDSRPADEPQSQPVSAETCDVKKTTADDDTAAVPRLSPAAAYVENRTRPSVSLASAVRPPLQRPSILPAAAPFLPHPGLPSTVTRSRRPAAAAPPSSFLPAPAVRQPYGGLWRLPATIAALERPLPAAFTAQQLYQHRRGPPPPTNASAGYPLPFAAEQQPPVPPPVGGMRRPPVSFQQPPVASDCQPPAPTFSQQSAVAGATADAATVVTESDNREFGGLASYFASKVQEEE